MFSSWSSVAIAAGVLQILCKDERRYYVLFDWRLLCRVERGQGYRQEGAEAGPDGPVGPTLIGAGRP